jgi:formylglycine-generating enzyme required for sulfatase activity
MPRIASGSDRVLRGGYWSSVAWYYRSANRNYAFPGNITTDVGFRVVLAPGQP